MVVAPGRVTVDVPAVTGLDAAVFTVPTDPPEADGMELRAAGLSRTGRRRDASGGDAS